MYVLHTVNCKQVLRSFIGTAIYIYNSNALGWFKGPTEGFANQVINVNIVDDYRRTIVA